MEQSIRNFAEQFGFEPEIKNKENLKPAEKFAIGGMGGSRLSAEILKSAFENIALTIHKNYGLPAQSGLPALGDKNSSETLIIASSFSGNTEETIDFLEKAVEQNLNTAVITKGGRLLEIAENKKLPFIKLPESDIQPRMALGWSLLALIKLIKPEILPGLAELKRILNPIRFEEQGESLAEEIKGKVPIIYASEKNRAIAEIWKIKLNETGKAPAFWNVFPELNHNEMTGFDYNESNAVLSKAFHFIFLKDENDHPRIHKRMGITEKIFEEKGFEVKMLDIEGGNRFERIFNSLILADWTALHIARLYDSEPEQVPMVEKFKKLITE